MNEAHFICSKTCLWPIIWMIIAQAVRYYNLVLWHISSLKTEHYFQEHYFFF